MGVLNEKRCKRLCLLDSRDKNLQFFICSNNKKWYYSYTVFFTKGTHILFPWPVINFIISSKFSDDSSVLIKNGDFDTKWTIQ